MDRKITKKKWTGKRQFMLVSSVALLSLVTYSMLSQSKGGSSIEVDPSRLDIAQVTSEQFSEFAPVSGVVLAEDTVFLDLEEGGIVEDIFIESGQKVKKGELILSFSNSTIQKQTIDSEARVLENFDRLRNTKIAITEKKLLLKDKLLDLDYEIKEQKRELNTFISLNKSYEKQVSRIDVESSQDKLDYLIGKRELLLERIERENQLREQQNDQVDKSIMRVKQSLKVLSQISDSLNVRAPIDGFLSSMSAEKGQSFQRGARIGQIDKLGKFVVRADVDQYFISKVSSDLTGAFDFDGSSYDLRVTKIYPEVKNNVFQIDLEFVGDVADGIKRGQSLQIDLNLSKTSVTNVIPKGGFYQHTGGRWLYVIKDNGKRAEKVSIQPGKQNPKSLEVVKGLKQGDWVITSSYEQFNGADEIVFSEALNTIFSG
ncbi:hypothetical protein A7985_14650 [Pseudoalteromonas luteoviolacea]|uniref:Multidrug resistance protein MdtA-like C-terminal permuted SH3 domain-containing protein n=1 Tax=Pseudoalteromonas luteoviolacea TaxID=43657 RepID=A0A1C0TQD4_9GAMM|nr:efflux RND transporter periplasmic adaptor subunit [Pseudoalteromonas luteoviolacea]OCQ21020.1 hypothetical protein A7985_14650 [Pseudoalteromonas luteoviolacea]